MKTEQAVIGLYPDAGVAVDDKSDVTHIFHQVKVEHPSFQNRLVVYNNLYMT
jgi:hypothetical protein